MNDPSSEQRLQAILHEYLQAIDRGEQPDRQAILDAHPDLREALGEFFADASKMQDLARVFKTTTFADSKPGNSDIQVTPQITRLRYIGDYELVHEIARGGMGIVYRAKQLTLNRLVALKMILKGELAGETEIRRFRHEAEAAARVDHPNIVPIYEVGEHEGQQYFSMQLIDCAPSPFVGAARQTGDIQRLAVIMLAKVARAVHHAHQRGILHRDLKPSNILIDGRYEPHVVDFGLARRVEGHDFATKSGAIVGTPAYMAPEQARASKELTTAVDIYSLGAILYEWLTGVPPFRGDDMVSTLLKLATEEPKSPRSLNRAVDRDLETIVLKCLEKDPQRRYGSAEGLAEDLERWLRGEVIQARRASNTERLIKWVKRRPAAAALILVSCSALVAMWGFSFWFATRLKEERDVALAAQAYADAKAKSESQARQESELERLTTRRLLYGSNIQLAFREWKNGEMFGVLRRLHDTPSELRSWEHAFVRRLALGEVFWGHSGPVTCVAVSPDGSKLASSDQDRTVLVWNALTGALALRFDGHSSAVNCVQFSPDGTKAASGDSSGTIQIWDASTAQVLQTIKAHQGSINKICFSQDGSRLASASSDKTAAVWDIATGKRQSQFRGHGNGAMFIQFSADGEQVVSSGFDNTVRFWNPTTGLESSNIKGIRAFALSPDGKRIAGADGSRIRILDLETKKEIKTLVGAVSYCNDLAFASDSVRLASSDATGVVTIWDTQTGNAQFTYRGHSGDVYSVAFSPDCQRLVSGGADRTVRTWDTRRGQEAMVIPTANKVGASIQFSPDGRRIVGLADQDFKKPGIVAIWDALTGRRLHTYPGNGKTRVGTVCFHPKGDRIATGDSEHVVRVLETATGRELKSFNGHTHVVHSVCFSPNGTRLASAAVDRTVRVWDLATGEALVTKQAVTAAWMPCTSSEGSGFMPGCLAFSPDGRWLASSLPEEPAVLIWNADTGAPVWKLTGHHRPIYGLDFQKDGRLLATASGDGTIKLWNLTSGKESRTLKGHAGVVGVRFFPDGKRLMSTGHDGAKLWDTETGQEILALPGAWTVDVSSDSKRVVTAAENQLRIYESIPGPTIVPLEGHTDRMLEACFSPDGIQVATTASDHTLRIWEAATGSLLRTITYTRATPYTGRPNDEYETLSVAYSPDGSMLALGTWDGYVKLFDAMSAQPLATWKAYDHNVISVRFSKEGQWLATTTWPEGEAEKITYWDLKTRERAPADLPAPALLQPSRRSPDGKRFVHLLGYGASIIDPPTPEEVLLRKLRAN